MSHAHDNFQHLQTPPKVKLPAAFFTTSLVLAAVGLLTFLAGLFALHDPARVWKAYLIGFVFFTLLALSGPFFVAIQHLARAGWSVTVRRIPEAFTPFLVPAAVLGLIFCLGGINSVYEWPHEQYHDALITRKLPYLNTPGMIIRTIIAFSFWTGLGLWLFKNSLKQDEVGGWALSRLNGKISPLFIVTMALSLTMFSVDFVMSLHPHWFSTMWAVNIWVTMWQSGLALSTIIVVLLHRKGTLTHFINENHIHDMGKLVFAITAFWAYIAFCQFLLMWYANLPEEAIFWNARLHHGWEKLTVFMAIGKFIVPFFLLLPRNVKRGKGLVPICAWIIFMCAFEVYWWVAPAPEPAIGGHGAEAGHGAQAAHPIISPELPWFEILVFLGFAGLFAFVVGKTFERINIIPTKDPRLHEALNHHQ